MTTLTTQAEIQAKLSYLESELRKDDPSAARAGLQDVWVWVSDRAGITVDVLTAVPVTAPYAPIVKVALGVALLPRDRRQAREGCDKLRDRMLQIFEDSYTLRQNAPAAIDNQMDQILELLVAHVRKDASSKMPDWMKGVWKDKTLALISDLDTKLSTLQSDYIVSAELVPRYSQKLSIFCQQTPALRRQGVVLDRIEVGIKTLTTQAQAASVRYEGPYTLHCSVRTKFSHVFIRSTPLQPPPSNKQLVGREDQVDDAVRRLQRKEHTTIVGVGGLGKTSLATVTFHDSQLDNTFGRRVYVRCARLETLQAFQLELLRIRAPRGLENGEDLAEAVRIELRKESTLLTLDNLLDNPFKVPADYRQFISTLADLPDTTLLITSRNQQLTRNFSSTRQFHALQLDALSNDASEQLFREELEREQHSLTLATPEPILSDVLHLLGGIPLAIRLVASFSRSAPNLRHVIDLWTTGAAAAWENNGINDRDHSLKFSLALSFRYLSNEAINLLRLLCGLPYSMPHLMVQVTLRKLPAIAAALDGAVRCSLAQVKETGTWRDWEQIEILEPVRQYVRQRWSTIDINSDVVRQLALGYFSLPGTYEDARDKNESFYLDIDWNFLALLQITQGIAGGSLEQPRLNAALRFVDEKRFRNRETRCILLDALGISEGKDQHQTFRDTIVSKLRDIDLFDGVALIQNAASAGDVEALRLLLKADGYSVKPSYNSELSAALIDAAKAGHFEVFKALFNAGVSFEMEDSDDDTSHFQAAEIGAVFRTMRIAEWARLLRKASRAEADTQVVNALRQLGTSIDRLNTYDETELHASALRADLRSVGVLLEAGASVHIRDKDNQTPLHFVAGCRWDSSSKGEVTQLLIDFEAPLDSADNVGETPLHKAARHGNWESMEVLLHVGALVDMTNSKNQTPLHLSAGQIFGEEKWDDEEKAETIKAAKLLIEFGAPLDSKDDKGETPLQTATRFGFSEISKLISEALEARTAKENLESIETENVASDEAGPSA
ncbi:hypothetical protein P7C70_g7838, partial [Phenoliferia sp. Uapishka_3]